jgi:hypothetical protein
MVIMGFPILGVNSRQWGRRSKIGQSLGGSYGSFNQ